MQELSEDDAVRDKIKHKLKVALVSAEGRETLVTRCGLTLFEMGAEYGQKVREERMRENKEDVTCKNCLKKMK